MFRQILAWSIGAIVLGLVCQGMAIGSTYVPPDSGEPTTTQGAGTRAAEEPTRRDDRGSGRREILQ